MVSKEEVLQKIGRNLLLFQQKERLLKFILTEAAIDGYASELQARREEREATINKKTMRQLVGDFVKGHLVPDAPEREAQQKLKEVWFRGEEIGGSDPCCRSANTAVPTARG
ncbi:hypothetical protein E5S69_07655 [Cupriavidus necator]|uniref:hypothetical protein n=1 Tax=Cupriavidus necator TaxID=106590 RepID=UPI0014904E6A|nr:hypothetical protein [Cupriavidus necator]NOV23415.1 hypothetical protein [Cupriavidus necator]